LGLLVAALRGHVHPHEEVAAVVELALELVSGLGDLALEPARLDGAEHPPARARTPPRGSAPPASRSRWSNTASAWRSISSVSSSTNHEPPSGSVTFATRVSLAITCWVRNARRAGWWLGG